MVGEGFLGGRVYTRVLVRPSVSSDVGVLFRVPDMLV